MSGARVVLGELDFCAPMKWLITDKGDDDARALVDGERTNGIPHYSRQTPGARLFTRNGQNLVFVTADSLAVWVTFRPTPGKATRPDKLDAWECAMFRNDGPELSSDLIREACNLSRALWGQYPRDGLITYVKPSAVKTTIPGYCYRRAGWRRVGFSSDGKPMFRAPRHDDIPELRAWNFKHGRGGKLRETLEVGFKMRRPIAFRLASVDYTKWARPSSRP
jgi:hypothetical protein